MSAPWSPQVGPQLEAITADWCDELFFGGAAGGGKSDYLLGDYLQDVETYAEHWRGILFRKTLGELEEIIARSHEIYPQSGGQWKDQKKTWVWPNGATLKLRYMEHERDFIRYQGHQYTWIGWDELTNWPNDTPYRKMMSRLRSAHGVPTKRVRAAANPGGVGHQWVKAYFIDPAPTGFSPIDDPDTGRTRIFIPSRVTDNRILLAADPGYVQGLKGVGSPTLVKAWLEGDWNVVTGAYFPEFSTEKHVVEPHALPQHWTRFRAKDWGSASPFSVGWYAVSDGTPCENGRIYPVGALIKYREWYGATTEGGSATTRIGLKMYDEKVAQGIKERELATERIKYSVADPSMWNVKGGISSAEEHAKNGVVWSKADNSRVQGWQQVRKRLEGREGVPMLYFFSTCTDIIRTLPTMQHDEREPEDLDTETEDHAVDELRYACMSRPMVAKSTETQQDKLEKAVEQLRRKPTFDELVKRARKRRMANN